MVPRSPFVLVALTALLFFLASVPTAAQFGITKKAQDVAEKLLQEAELDASGDRQGFLSAQDAADMDELIRKAKADPQTIELIARMKAEMKDDLDKLSKEPPEEILGGMKQALDETKMLNYLFKDKARALREMEKEGMIEKKNLKKYKQDPDLLEEDTRRGLYFQFVSLAVAGGFM